MMDMTMAEFFEIGGPIALAFIILLVLSVLISAIRDRLGD